MRVNETINTDGWITCQHCQMTYNPVMRHFCGEQAEREIAARRAQVGSLPQTVIVQMGGIIEQLNARIESVERERDAALALLAEAWEWTTPRAVGKLGYRDLQRRVRAALAAKEEPGGEETPPGHR